MPPALCQRPAPVRSAPAWCGTRCGEVLADRGAYAEQQARIVDIGGGTGGFAVPLAELGPPGHRSSTPAPTPSPRSTAGPRERGVADRVTGRPGRPGRACRRWPPTPRRRRPGALPRRARGGRRPRRPRWPRSPRCCVPAAPSASWSPSATPPSSRAPWPATSRPGPGAARRRRPATPDPAAAGTASPPTSSPPCSTAAGLRGRRGARRPGLRRPRPRLACSTSSPAPAAALVELEQAVADAPGVPPPRHPAARARASADPRPRPGRADRSDRVRERGPMSVDPS